MAKNFQVKGFEEVQKILDALPKTLGPKTVQKALKEGAKPLVNKTKENASSADVTGNLRKSIGIINARGSQKGSGIYVGPRRGKGVNAKGWHAHLVEYGTAPHVIKPKMKRGGKAKVLKFNGTYAAKTYHPGTKAFPFLRPAWEQTNGQVQIEIKRSLQEVLRSNFKGVKF